MASQTACYLVLVFFLAAVVVLSCLSLLSQAVRTDPGSTWVRNFNALIIGATYIIVIVLSFFMCLNRRISVQRRLSKISQTSNAIGRSDVPKKVHDHISREYVRSCAAAYESLPTNAHHPGWGRPGTLYAGIRFRRSLLDTLPEIDALARTVVPSLPIMRPNSRIGEHLHFLSAMFPYDADGHSIIDYYAAAVELARISSRELTETEYEIGVNMSSHIKRILLEVQMERLEENVKQENATRPYTVPAKLQTVPEDSG